MIQKYEYFEGKYGETVTETYDKFTKLLNDMAMHNKYYVNKDMNTKFMKALPEIYDEKCTSIREANDLNEIILEDMYGKLRVYELEK